MALFEEALNTLRLGGTVRRASWDESYQWIKLDMGDLEVEGDPDCIVLKAIHDTELHPWVASSRDLVAADWEVITN